jgi:hypothetical protein
MIRKAIEKIPFHFTDISVLIPVANGMVASDKGLPFPNAIEGSVGFNLIRHIANIVILTNEDYENQVMSPVTDFEQPIELRVAYRNSDLAKCNWDPDQLKLAYWDGGNWVIISDAEHEYQILPDTTGMVAEAKIWHWVGDPPLAWGT